MYSVHSLVFNGLLSFRKTFTSDSIEDASPSNDVLTTVVTSNQLEYSVETPTHEYSCSNYVFSGIVLTCFLWHAMKTYCCYSIKGLIRPIQTASAVLIRPIQTYSYASPVLIRPIQSVTNAQHKNISSQHCNTF